jgi:hypothetical protein
MMDAVSTSETSVNFCQTTWHNIPEDKSTTYSSLWETWERTKYPILQQLLLNSTKDGKVNKSFAGHMSKKKLKNLHCSIPWTRWHWVVCIWLRYNTGCAHELKLIPAPVPGIYQKNSFWSTIYAHYHYSRRHNTTVNTQGPKNVLKEKFCTTKN